MPGIPIHEASEKACRQKAPEYGVEQSVRRDEETQAAEEETGQGLLNFPSGKIGSISRVQRSHFYRTGKTR